MMSSDHTNAHVTNSEKNVNYKGFLKCITLSGFFIDLILFFFLALCIDFVHCPFLKCQILREFQNVEKFLIF